MRRKVTRTFLFVLLMLSLLLTSFPGVSLAATDNFFAAAQTSGSIQVKLYPTEGITGTKLVTFGVPFTRGSLTPANLSKVRVLKNGVEIPAYVEQLTPWRHTTNASIDGQYVRFARIQINYAFTVSYPNYETITVEWGTTTRTQNITTFTNPRTAWHLVTSGTFTSADGVYEPDVYAVLPKEVMSNGVLRQRMTTFSDAISATRDNPTTMDATQHYPGYTEYDYASKNFFYSIINEDDPAVTPANQCAYKTDYDPWLYDRSSSMYVLYFRSGFFKPLREAVRAADFYINHIDANGSFTLKGADPKYSYDECMAYTYWLTGDNNAITKLSNIITAYNGVTTRWSPSLGFWTERNSGYKLLAYTIAYELSGTSTYKTGVQNIVDDFIWHQDGAGGQIPSPRIDGGLYHTGSQHSEGTNKAYLASPWMSTLLVDAMVRAYGVTEDSRIANFIVRMGNMVKVASKTDSNAEYKSEYASPLRYPDYLMKIDGTSDMRSSTDDQHAMDVGIIGAWANYFANVRGTPDPTLAQLANDLYFTHDIGINYWTRPAGPASGLTAYRVSPWRKYGWEYRTTASFSWIMNQ